PTEKAERASRIPLLAEIAIEFALESVCLFVEVSLGFGRLGFLADRLEVLLELSLHPAPSIFVDYVDFLELLFGFASHLLFGLVGSLLFVDEFADGLAVGSLGDQADQNHGDRKERSHSRDDVPVDFFHSSIGSDAGSGVGLMST